MLCHLFKFEYTCNYSASKILYLSMPKPLVQTSSFISVFLLLSERLIKYW